MCEILIAKNSTKWRVWNISNLFIKIKVSLSFTQSFWVSENWQKCVSFLVVVFVVIRHIQPVRGCDSYIIIVHIEYLHIFFSLSLSHTCFCIDFSSLATSTWGILTGRNHNPIRLQPPLLLLFLSAVKPKFSTHSVCFDLLMTMENFLFNPLCCLMRSTSGKQTQFWNRVCRPYHVGSTHITTTVAITTKVHSYIAFVDPTQLLQA